MELKRLEAPTVYASYGSCQETQFSFHLPSKTSGAIHAAEPLLSVMLVLSSHAVPKSHTFSTFAPLVKSRFGGLRSLRKGGVCCYENHIVHILLSMLIVFFD